MYNCFDSFVYLSLAVDIIQAHCLNYSHLPLAINVTKNLAVRHVVFSTIFMYSIFVYSISNHVFCLSELGLNKFQQGLPTPKAFDTTVT